jgi:hypothetical protein
MSVGATGRGSSQRRRRLAGWMCCVGLVVVVTVVFAGGSLVAAPSDDAPLDEILRRAGTYVSQVERDLTTVIADESYDQRVELPTLRLGAPSKRVMRSEIIFIWIPDERVLLSVRNVLDVDGKAIPDSGDRLQQALKAPPDARTSRLKQLLDEGARFNLGPVIRNAAEPALPLEFLDPRFQPRFTFALAGFERTDGADVARISFAEHERPTVITDRGTDVFSSGMLWVRVSDGVVLRAEVAATIPTPRNLAVSITVSFAHDPKLDMWVPARMNERYQQSYSLWLPNSGIAMPSSRYVTINCVARYSNFRRFETSGRVVSPK